MLPPHFVPRPLPAAAITSLFSPLAAAAAAESSNTFAADLVQFVGQKLANFDWNFGTIYALLCLSVYAVIAAQGRAGVIMRSGKVYQDGVEVAQPFKRSAEQAASAAAAANRAEKVEEEEREN